MENRADILMLDGVVAFCADCDGDRTFVPAGDGRDRSVEFCCTTCDAAVFLLEVLGNTRAPHTRVA